jgi:superfamily II DNA or RNA helicase
MFCQLILQLGTPRTLILVNRTELVGQTLAALRAVCPGLDVGVVHARLKQVHRCAGVAVLRCAML